MMRWLLILVISTVLMADEYCTAYQAYENDNLIEAKKELDKIAFKGNTKAQNLLGLVNLNNGDTSAAQKWFQNAAVKDDLKAAYNLGIYYYNRGQISQTEKWMRKAKDLPQAKTALGILYAASDAKKAKAYFYIPAMEGSKLAKAHLCALPNLEKDENREKYDALCQGYALQASLITGKFYNSPKKYGSNEKSLYYLKYAVDQGNAEAMNIYGTILYKRRGQSDEENALNLFTRAAALGNVDAKVNAAWIYYVGSRWTRKPELGLQELNSALAQNNAKAKLYMGILYLRGYDFSSGTVAKNVNKGWELIRASAAQDDPQAMEYLIKNGVRGKELQEYQDQLDTHYRNEDKARDLHFLYDGC